MAFEVRTHGRARADIGIILDGEVVAIEGKMDDWRRAISQAFLNIYCADRSYVALWCEQAAQVSVEEVQAAGIGLISIGPTSYEIVRPAPNSKPDPTIRHRMKEQIQNR